MKRLISCLIIAPFLVSCVHLKPHPRPWTAEEKSAAVYFISGHTADALSTREFLRNPNNYERNPILGKEPSDTNIAIYFSLTSILAIGIAHYYPELRVPLLFCYGTLGFELARHNNKLPKEK